MTPFHIWVLRHSAFYCSLLMTIAGRFLEIRGLSPGYDMATAWNMLGSGREVIEVHLKQSDMVGAMPDRSKQTAWLSSWQQSETRWFKRH